MVPFKSNARVVQTCLFALVVLALSFSFGTASAEIKLTDNLSISGFLDMSSVLEVLKDDDDETTDETTTSLSFDQFELDFHFNYGSVTARVDIDSTGSFTHPAEDIGQSQDVVLEQGFVTYTFSKDVLPGASITAGRFLSSFGFETAEPTGLYQFSFSEGIPYPAYQNGVAVSLKPTQQIPLKLSKNLI